MSWYSAGSVSVTTDSLVVIGTGTQFIKNTKSGDIFMSLDGLLYEIDHIASDTQFTLTKSYKGTTNALASYTVIPTQAYLKTLAGQVADLIALYSDIPADAEAARTAAQDAQNYRSEAVNASAASIAARDTAEMWKTAAAGYSEAASVSAAEADAAQAAAEQARTDAQTAKGLAESARDASVTAKTASESARNAAASSATLADQRATDAAVNLTAVTNTANNALSVANGIDSKAQQALDNSNAATTTANQAKTTANGIDAKAQQALDNSVAATNTANSMVTSKINVDGTIQFTGHQKLKDSSPTDPLHAASKQYVDWAGSDDAELIINPHGVIRQLDGAVTASGYFADQWVYDTAGSGFTAQADAENGGVSLFDPSNLVLKTTAAKGSLAAGDSAWMRQPVEGLYHRRLLYGTAGARGSWLRWRAVASQAGTASVSIRNAGLTRSFVHTFAVTTTPTDYSVFVPGDTTGTWPSGEQLAAHVTFAFASGSSGQTPTLDAWQAGNFFAGTAQSNMLDTVNRSLKITDVSWRGSNILLPFRSPNVPDDLRRAQRYLEVANGVVFYGNQASATDNYRNWWVQFSVEKWTSTYTGVVVVNSVFGNINIKGRKGMSANFDAGNTTAAIALQVWQCLARLV